MQIGILETGRPPQALQADHGSYADMFKRLLGNADSTLTFRTYAVLDDELPASPSECDGWLVTGSRHGAYENLPWMLALQAFIRATQAAGVPTVGICFGHQIIAAALGGHVEKSEKGWGLGLQTYTVTQNLPWLAGHQDFTINSLHQDQVVALPPGADVFASSAFCEYAGLVYGDTILTFQGHPEFSSAFEQELLELRRGNPLPEALADQALVPLKAGEQPEAQTGQWLAAFFRQQR